MMRTHSTIGVQGLADVFLKLSHPFDSLAAQQLSVDISATVYHSATNANADLATSKGCLPIYRDYLAPLGIVPCLLSGNAPECTRHDWEQLAAKLQISNVRRLLLIAYTPLPPTSSLRHLAQGCHPYQTYVTYRCIIHNLINYQTCRYVGIRRTIIGPITVVSEHLLDALERANVLTPQLVREIQASGGEC